MKVILISFAPNFMLVTTSKVCADGSRPFPSWELLGVLVHFSGLRAKAWALSTRRTVRACGKCVGFRVLLPTASAKLFHLFTPQVLPPWPEPTKGNRGIWRTASRPCWSRSRQIYTLDHWEIGCFLYHTVRCCDINVTNLSRYFWAIPWYSLLFWICTISRRSPRSIRGI